MKYPVSLLATLFLLLSSMFVGSSGDKFVQSQSGCGTQQESMPAAGNSNMMNMQSQETEDTKSGVKKHQSEMSFGNPITGMIP